MRRCWTFIACLWAVFLVSGCASTSQGSRTGGVTLSLRIEESKNKAVYYAVDSNGTLGFGGGLDARFDRISWTGRMQDEELAELLTLIEQNQLFERKPVGTGDPKSLRWRFEVSGPKGWKRSRLTGECPILRQVYELLDASSRKRFKGILETLPKPGQWEPN